MNFFQGLCSQCCRCHYWIQHWAVHWLDLAFRTMNLNVGWLSKFNVHADFYELHRRNSNLIFRLLRIRSTFLQLYHPTKAIFHKLKRIVSAIPSWSHCVLCSASKIKAHRHHHALHNLEWNGWLAELKWNKRLPFHIGHTRKGKPFPRLCFVERWIWKFEIAAKKMLFAGTAIRKDEDKEEVTEAITCNFNTYIKMDTHKAYALMHAHIYCTHSIGRFALTTFKEPSHRNRC